MPPLPILHIRSRRRLLRSMPLSSPPPRCPNRDSARPADTDLTDLHSPSFGCPRHLLAHRRRLLSLYPSTSKGRGASPYYDHVPPISITTLLGDIAYGFTRTCTHLRLFRYAQQVKYNLGKSHRRVIRTLKCSNEIHLFNATDLSSLTLYTGLSHDLFAHPKPAPFDFRGGHIFHF